MTHTDKTAEVKTGAGTSTVTRVLARRINEGAAEQDKVSEGALQDRVRRNEGVKVANRQNKTPDSETASSKRAKRPNKPAPPAPPVFLSQAGK